MYNLIIRKIWNDIRFKRGADSFISEEALTKPKYK